MAAGLEPSPGSLAGSRRPRKAGLEDRLIARMLAPWLDRELAAGMQASLSEAHAARAEQLAGDDVRHAVARSLERLLARAEKPPSAARKATIPPCREQIAAAAPLIASTAARLRSREAMDPCAVARLKILVGDRRGPCYVSSSPDALAAALRAISEPPTPTYGPPEN